jgi:DNA-binding NtrC family response regulator
MESEKQEHSVLVVARRDYVLETVGGVLMRSGYSVLTAMDDEQVIKLLKLNLPDVLLIGGGVEPNSRLAFRRFIVSQMPQVKIVEHFGGPATLVSEVGQAIGVKGETASQS